MNTPLWTNISTFDLDEPISDYGFSIRLAQENRWTIDFTQKAITEYKKFIYLAATAGSMVSPSPIVDLVWHQHLIFTESYAALCTLCGKKIQHIPSTHNREEAARFKQAADRTKDLYNSTFGEQPKEIWEAETIFDSLQLPRARWRIRKFTQMSILVFLLLVVPFYFLLKPLYVRIDSPAFLIGYLLLAVMVFTVLHVYNEAALAKIVTGFAEAAYVRHLQPLELVYLEKRKLPAVVHGTIDQLLKEKKIIINRGHTLELASQQKATTVEEHTVRQILETGAISYPALLRRLTLKPVFTNIYGSMEAFREFFVQSKAFGNLFYLNTCALLLTLMLGLVRSITGIARHKPVAIICALAVAVLIVLLIFLVNLSCAVCTSTLPEFYKKHLLPEKQYQPHLDWQYFLIGTAILSPDFVPMVNHCDQRSNSSGGDSSWSGDSSSSSCGSSCGSGCGSSCGGCGGGD